MRLSRALMLGFIVLVGGAAVGCSSTSLLAPLQTPNLPPSASPTPPVIPQGAAASAQSLVTLSAAQQALAVPTVAGYAGTVTLPAPASLPAGSSVDTTTSNTAIDSSSGVPALLAALRAPQTNRTDAAASLITVLLYFKLVSNATIVYPNAPAITLTVPATSIVPNAAYYLAEFDPLRSGLGWQKAFEGPATISGTTLTFGGPSPAAQLTLTAQSPLYIALYAVGTAAATPSPAPSSTPAPAPTPIPAFTLSAATISLLSVGATGTATITDPSTYAGSYAATSSASSVATATLSGKTLTVTAVAVGTATITIGDSQGRTAQVTVQVTTTTLPLQ